MRLRRALEKRAGLNLTGFGGRGRITRQSKCVCCTCFAENFPQCEVTKTLATMNERSGTEIVLPLVNFPVTEEKIVR